MTVVIKVIFSTHLCNESFNAIEVLHILLDKITYLQERLELVWSSKSHDSVNMRGVVALMLGGSSERLRHCKGAAHHASVLSEFVLARHNFALLEHGLKVVSSRYFFAATWTVQAHA